MTEIIQKMTPRRKTRQMIAKVMTFVLVAIVGWIFLPGDIGDNERMVLIAIIGFASTYLVSFAGFETANDHSERKNSD